VHADPQLRLVALGGERVLCFTQIEIVAADAHVIVERSGWKRILFETIAPGHALVLAPFGRDLIEVDALAHGHVTQVFTVV
jgi:hypothetical protein